MEVVHRGLGRSGAIGSDGGVILSVDQEQRKVSGVGETGFDLLVALARAHLGHDGCETVRPQRGVIERASASVAETGYVDAIAIDVEALQNVIENGVEAASDLRGPPVSGGLRIEDEIIRLCDDVFSGVHGVDGITGAATEIDEQRCGSVAGGAVRRRNAKQVGNLWIVFCGWNNLERGPGFSMWRFLR